VSSNLMGVASTFGRNSFQFINIHPVTHSFPGWVINTASVFIGLNDLPHES
jgi:hypothetical protein